MNIRAVIADVYGTLLGVGPAPTDAEARWEFLWEDKLRITARLSLKEFSAACDAVIAREHAAARQHGIQLPEIYWPGVVSEVLPELARLVEAERDEFLYRQAQAWHTVRLMPGAPEILRALAGAGVRAGIASNAQAYTIRELDVALAGAGLSRACFTPDLCFWSCEHGFSKPDPHVFRLLSARLQRYGIKGVETLMVGDRWDTDIEPARAQGWQTWLLTASPAQTASTAGGWDRLAACLGLPAAPALH